ncbi:hypothetical protein AAFX15_07940 [Vibrio chagasii]|uniref:AbiU2 domain-containing protein n=1 Tax=Vibrio chagasii TaxID=170679 RepID=UPI0038CED816
MAPSKSKNEKAHKMKSPWTIEDFETVTLELQKEVQMLTMHWDVLQKIDAEFDVNLQRFTDNSYFWMMTFNAHLTSVRLLISRIYDTNTSTLSISNWLNIVGDFIDRNEFTIEPESELKDQLASDKRACKNNLVKKFSIQLRNNAIAHTSIKYAKRGICPFKDNNVQVNEYQELITQAQVILNNYIPYILGYRVSYRSLNEKNLKCLL